VSTHVTITTNGRKMNGRINSFSKTAYTVSFEFRSVGDRPTMALYQYLVAGVAKLVATGFGGSAGLKSQETDGETSLIIIIKGRTSKNYAKAG
jgi:hypothetical protein